MELLLPLFGKKAAQIIVLHTYRKENSADMKLEMCRFETGNCQFSHCVAINEITNKHKTLGKMFVCDKLSSYIITRNYRRN